MVKCSVKSCNSKSNNHKKSSGITFHAVPRCPERRFIWMKRIRLLRKETDWIPTKNSVICSKHFLDNDKIQTTSESGRIFLSKDAVPRLPEELYVKEQNSENTDEDSSTLETDDEIEEMTETPKEQNMRKIILRLTKICKRRLNRIKALEGRNKRLIAGKKKLKGIIGELIKDKKNI